MGTQWNNQVSSFRAPVERAVATLKTWRFSLHRLPSATEDLQVIIPRRNRTLTSSKRVLHNPLCELICRWRMKWRYIRLYEIVVQKAAERPDDANLRTLLIDLASTHLDDLGDRIPIRGDLKLFDFHRWGVVEYLCVGLQPISANPHAVQTGGYLRRGAIGIVI